MTAVIENEKNVPPGPPAKPDDGVFVTLRETPRAVKALLFGGFISRLAAFIQIYLVLFLTDRGFSATQAGLALGIYGAGAVVGSLAGGSLSDRLGARTVTLISMGGSALLIVSILYAPTYALLLAAVFMVSTVGQFYRPAAQTMLTELTPRHRVVMITAMYRLGLNLGMTAAPLIGAALLSFSYNALFWGEATAALIFGVTVMFALPRRAAHAAYVAEKREAVAEDADPATQGRSGYLAVFADWRYSVYLLAMLLTSIVYCQYTATLPLDISAAGISLWWYGAAVSLNGFIVITCELAMTKIVQKWPIRLTALLGLGLVSVGYAIYAISPLPIWFMIGTLVWTLSEIIGGPTTFAYPALAGPERLRGRYIGAMQSVFGLGTAIGPVIGTLVWFQVGRSVWLWAALVSAIATVAGLIGMRDPHKAEESRPATASAT
ncbi:MFS transporter [Streptosporangium amethystogenes]|uniref:MFS transporter n=1 Tax=Streptosporangium amethystogenes TaxID=2002 RepID=UPI001B809D69|nr:MFS transporter [Streptosporangium amethystogenes]